VIRLDSLYCSVIFWYVKASHLTANELYDENCELRTQIGLIAVARAFEKASAFYL